MSRGTRIFIIGVLALAAGWIFSPALQGYHIGENPGTGDNVCINRIVQWCRNDYTLVLPPGYVGPVPNPAPDCQIARPPCRNSNYP